MQPMWRRKEEALLLQSCSATFFGVRVPGCRAPFSPGRPGLRRPPGTHCFCKGDVACPGPTEQGSLTQRPQCNDFLCAPRLAGLCGADRAKLHVRAAVGICTAL
ncbi:unnamed protein product [Prorocentrum cordatum]|uniref:Uncharacterized protein n=1 Tax=Prorocentrum cordatum TaxID=2364126 RepID=A0ABN9PNE9_9DINO|nr:unnamed protein product [Polarella glacialis]